MIQKPKGTYDVFGKKGKTILEIEKLIKNTNEINQMTLNCDIIIYTKNVVESELLYEKNHKIYLVLVFVTCFSNRCWRFNRSKIRKYYLFIVIFCFLVIALLYDTKNAIVLRGAALALASGVAYRTCTVPESQIAVAVVPVLA